MQADDEAGEAEVVPAMAARRNDDQDNNDSLRVIDADDDRDVTDTADAAQPENRDRASGDRNRRGRKPYRPREEGAAREERAPREARPPREPVEAVVVSETDGIMKTLSRGRRKPAPEEGAPVEPTD
jgi:ribonuclease E